MLCYCGAELEQQAEAQLAFSASCQDSQLHFRLYAEDLFSSSFCSRRAHPSASATIIPLPLLVYNITCSVWMELQSTFAGAGAMSMGDAFHIDDLLDFSNEDIAGPIGDSLLSSLDSTLTEIENHLNSGSSSLVGTKHLLDGDDAVAGDLCVPCSDLAELEWLSKFVEDSFSAGEVTRPGGLTVSTEHHIPIESFTNKDRFQSASPVSVLESSASSERANNAYRELSTVPGRARSKRARTGGRVWGTTARILSSSSNSGSGSGNDTESLSSDSSAMTGSDRKYSVSQSTLSVDSQLVPVMMNAPPKAVCSSAKKSWKGGAGGGKSGKKGQDAALQPWRCLHCSTTRTPQWRAGPMGPKTLCNACGVRYKSGRLLPEYRPAGSPGYIGHKHSNSHKKILEMRRQREQQQQHILGQSSQSSSILSDPSCQASPSSNHHFLEIEDSDICNSQS
ncbi:hypothetical protein R1flu_020672 [Riccia fluitans]|uniref:GATA-type domain-containing protein n=1 Tax=Riccia fluitans TaxID=41844 RepID=A0ABD1ZM65_9MARC